MREMTNEIASRAYRTPGAAFAARLHSFASKYAVHALVQCVAVDLHATSKLPSAWALWASASAHESLRESGPCLYVSHIEVDHTDGGYVSRDVSYPVRFSGRNLPMGVC